MTHEVHQNVVVCGVYDLRSELYRPRAEKNLRGARAVHDPTTMMTDLSCFSLSRVREYLIK